MINSNRYQLVPFNGEFLLIDVEDEIKIGDKIYSPFYDDTTGCAGLPLTDWMGWEKIISATYKIDDLPLLCNTKDEIIDMYKSDEIGKKWEEANKQFTNGINPIPFRLGYKSNKASYTEEDLKKAFNAGEDRKEYELCKCYDMDEKWKGKMPPKFEKFLDIIKFSLEPRFVLIDEEHWNFVSDEDNASLSYSAPAIIRNTIKILKLSYEKSNS